MDSNEVTRIIDLLEEVSEFVDKLDVSKDIDMSMYKTRTKAKLMLSKSYLKHVVYNLEKGVDKKKNT